MDLNFMDKRFNINFNNIQITDKLYDDAKDYAFSLHANKDKKGESTSDSGLHIDNGKIVSIKVYLVPKLHLEKSKLW